MSQNNLKHTTLREMDLGESYASLSERSNPASFHIQRKAVGSRISSTPLLAEDHQEDELQPESTSDASSELTITRSPYLKGHERKFSPRKQFMRLLSVGAIRFLITAALIGGMYGTMWFYKAKPVMSQKVDKMLFNFYTTGLSMLLGISIASGLKQIAVDVRWQILSRRNRPLREVDEILNVNSLTKLLHLALSSLRNWKLGISTVSLSWIAINMGGQAGVAMLALTYSLSPVTVSSPPEIGTVLVSDLSSFVSNFGPGDGGDMTRISSRQANQLAAHTYGEMSPTYGEYVTTKNDSLTNPIEPNVLHNDTFMYYWQGPGYYQYVFQQWYYDGNSSIGQFYSNRSIAASSTCSVFDVKEGANGSVNSIQYQNSTGTLVTQSFKLIQPNSTTYYTNADVADCGPRCATVSAFENNGRAGFYYECQITLSNVTNVYDPVHVISDYTARTAAASIALQGYQSEVRDAQFQRYPEEFYYGLWLNGDPLLMADRMRKFAIGAIVGADQNNPSYSLTGPIPRQGVVLTIDKPKLFHGILLTIASVQLVLFICGALLANRVVVVDESYFSIANLFKPLLKDLHDGSLLNGEEICDVLGKEKTVRYGSALRESEKGEIRYLRIESDGIERRFPRGWYN